ncbi:hypothetical protein [Gallaecimonas sp. GXIMD1310]|uniref:hypothetical protein n=1 Tax=Gallaecimonas sp. GXIMD1310 TaxID=3131926 RepID=UPI0032446842
MEQKGNKPKLKESNDPLDLLRMQTEFALLSSIFKSKTLAVMAIVGVLAFSGFGYFLFKMAANQA